MLPRLSLISCIVKCTLILSLSIFWGACGSSKKTAQIETKPVWVDSRPVDNFYYTGIGVARKWGSHANYTSDAREKALVDMAAQVNTHIASTSVLHQIENKQGVSEMLANQIKASSKEFLEGYEMVDDWQDETTYYVYYRLSKSKFAQLKEKRRTEATQNALARFNTALETEQTNQTAEALINYAKALEALKDYLGESNLTETPQGSKDIAIQSLAAIKKLIGELKIVTQNNEIKSNAGQMIAENLLTFTVLSANGTPQNNIPVGFHYSGGFLRKDADITNLDGKASTFIQNVNAIQTNQTVCATINVANLAQQLTRDLLIRKLIENTGGHSTCVNIKI